MVMYDATDHNLIHGRTEMIRDEDFPKFTVPIPISYEAGKDCLVYIQCRDEDEDGEFEVAGDATVNLKDLIQVYHGQTKEVWFSAIRSGCHYLFIGVFFMFIIWLFIVYFFFNDNDENNHYN